MIRAWWNRNARDIKGCIPVLVLVAIPFVVTLPAAIEAAIAAYSLVGRSAE